MPWLTDISKSLGVLALSYPEHIRLGGPFYADGALNLPQWHARWHLCQSIMGNCPEMLLSLYELREYIDGAPHVPSDHVIQNWLVLNHFSISGKPADWALEMVKKGLLVSFSWEAWGHHVMSLFPPLPEGKAPMEREECRIVLPTELYWEPFQATRLHNGKNRIETREECRDRIMKLVDARLDAIEEVALSRGAKPTKTKVDTKHFDWAVRFQFKGESKSSIAKSEGLDQFEPRAVGIAIERVLKLVNLDSRVKRGRPVSK